MRSRAGRAAAALTALAALALAAGGCSDLVSSLTPFGLGDRGPDQDLVAYSGAWTGTTVSDGARRTGGFAFVVSGNLVGPFLLQHLTETCDLTLGSGEDVTVPIKDDRFTFEGALEPQGRLVVQGNFSSTTEVSGHYSFEGRAATTGCPTAGGGSFAATKLMQQ